MTFCRLLHDISAAGRARFVILAPSRGPGHTGSYHTSHNSYGGGGGHHGIYGGGKHGAFGGGKHKSGGGKFNKWK